MTIEQYILIGGLLLWTVFALVYWRKEIGLNLTFPAVKKGEKNPRKKRKKPSAAVKATEMDLREVVGAGSTHTGNLEDEVDMDEMEYEYSDYEDETAVEELGSLIGGEENGEDDAKRQSLEEELHLSRTESFAVRLTSGNPLTAEEQRQCADSFDYLHERGIKAMTRLARYFAENAGTQFLHQDFDAMEDDEEPEPTTPPDSYPEEIEPEPSDDGEAGEAEEADADDGNETETDEGDEEGAEGEADEEGDEGEGEEAPSEEGEAGEEENMSDAGSVALPGSEPEAPEDMEGSDDDYLNEFLGEAPAQTPKEKPLPEGTADITAALM